MTSLTSGQTNGMPVETVVRDGDCPMRTDLARAVEVSVSKGAPEIVDADPAAGSPAERDALLIGLSALVRAVRETPAGELSA